MEKIGFLNNQLIVTWTDFFFTCTWFLAQFKYGPIIWHYYFLKEINSIYVKVWVGSGLQGRERMSHVFQFYPKSKYFALQEASNCFHLDPLCTQILAFFVPTDLVNVSTDCLSRYAKYFVNLWKGRNCTKSMFLKHVINHHSHVPKVFAF